MLVFNRSLTGDIYFDRNERLLRPKINFQYFFFLSNFSFRRYSKNVIISLYRFRRWIIISLDQPFRNVEQTFTFSNILFELLFKSGKVIQNRASFPHSLARLLVPSIKADRRGVSVIGARYPISPSLNRSIGVRT